MSILWDFIWLFNPTLQFFVVDYVFFHYDINMTNFFNQILNWIKTNKLATLLLLIVAFFIYRQYYAGNRYAPISSGGFQEAYYEGASTSLGRAESQSLSMPKSLVEPGISDATDRMVTTNTSLSMKVDEVELTLVQIKDLAVTNGGFMVDSSFTQPEGAASATINVRVQSTQLDSFLLAIKDLAVKVVSENVSGRDITEQYENVNERLKILTQTKTRFEEIQRSAEEVQDMLIVQRELLNVQSQIDALLGRKEALEQRAELSLVTVYLSTDELALPYAPTKVWQSKLVVKNATRSLISTGRSLANLFIWAGIYTPAWLIGLIVIMIIKKIKSKKKLN